MEWAEEGRQAMMSYTKWDRAAYIERVGGEDEAEQSGQSLSAWLNDAARARLRVEDGLAAVAEWEAEHGALTDNERAAADRQLDQLVG